MNIVEYKEIENPNFEAYFYFLNGHNDVVYFADSNFTEENTGSYEYNPWGLPLTKANKNNLLYTAREFDFDIGLQFNRSRYYSVSLGRFNYKDFIFAFNNSFSYSLNNPIRFYDPFGLSIWGWIKKTWRKIWGTSTIEEAVCGGDPASCAQEYYYCEEDCVKCCQKKFPTATGDQTGACATNFGECFSLCMEHTSGVCMPPQAVMKMGKNEI